MSLNQCARAATALGVSIDVGTVARGVAQVTELGDRRSASIARGHAGALQLLGAHVDVQTELVFDVARNASGAARRDVEEATELAEVGHASLGRTRGSQCPAWVIPTLG